MSGVERAVLAGFECRAEVVVLHKDHSFLPPLTSDFGVVVLLPNKDEALPPYASTMPMTTYSLSDTDNETMIYATYDYDGADSDRECHRFQGETFHASFVHRLRQTRALDLFVEAVKMGPLRPTAVVVSLRARSLEPAPPHTRTH